MTVERFFTAFSVYEVALVVIATLIVMLLLRPRDAIEWATTGKEVAFTMIMTSALYRTFTGRGLPQPFASFLWGIVAVLLTIYLIIFFEQWTPIERFCRRCKVHPWLAVPIAIGIVFGAFAIAGIVWGIA